MSPVIQKVFGAESQQYSLFTLVYFILVFIFWWYYFYDATFAEDEEQSETFFVPSFAEIVETLGDYVGPTGVIGLTLFALLAKYKLNLL